MGTVAAKQERGGSPFLALMRTSVSLWIVVVMMAMSFGAGVIVKAISEPATVANTPTTLPTGGQIVAPPLTDDQIEGGLPSGHPTLSEDGDAEGQGGGGQNSGGGQNDGGQG